MASEISSEGDEKIQFLSSFPPLNLRQDLGNNLFDNDFEYEDCECNFGHVNHLSETVLTNSVTRRCRRCHAINIPFGRKKITLRGKGGRKVNNNK